MTTIYKPLAIGATPVQGTSGSAVLALQKQLNAQGAGLKEDALYGPLTAAAYAKYNTPTGTSTATKSTFVEPTIANSYESDPNYTYAQDIITKKMRGEDIVDTNAIRSDVLAGFQDRINSLNSIYAQKLSEAKQQGVGRVGQTTAILANRGLAGSMRGGAIAEGTLDQNKQIEDAIANEKNLAIQELYGKASEMAVEEAARRRQAIEGGATSYIDFVKNQEITKKDNLGQFASAFIAQGIDPSTMTPDELKGIADKLKVSTNDIISAYKQKEYESKQKAIKDAPTPPASVAEYEYAKAGGYTGSFSQYQNEDANRKAKVAGAGNGLGGMFSNSQINSTINSIAGSFDNEPIVKEYNTIARNVNTYKNLGNSATDDIQRVYTFAKVADPNSAVKEGEYSSIEKYSQALLQRAGLKVARVFTATGILTPEARTAMQKTLETSLNSAKKAYDNTYSQYQKRIDKAKSGEGNSLTNYGTAFDDNSLNSNPDPLGLGI